VLVIIVCIGLLVGCSGPSQQSIATSPIHSSPSSTTTAAASPNVPNSQNIMVNMPSFAILLNAVEPSVVQVDISATTTSPFGRTVQEQGAGSGWIIDSNGTIVTNNHVVKGATSIIVTISSGQTFPAQVINTDPTMDLAVIKITTTIPLQSMKIGDASKVQSGDWVLALGNPLGEGITATQGIISRLGVNVPYSATQTYNNLIETTAPINPGNSGGPLVNMAGEVIGITTLGATGGVQGMGYAISMADALSAIQQLSASK
jgi:serine protease Do